MSLVCGHLVRNLLSRHADTHTRWSAVLEQVIYNTVVSSVPWWFVWTSEWESWRQFVSDHPWQRVWCCLRKLFFALCTMQFFFLAPIFDWTLVCKPVELKYGIKLTTMAPAKKVLTRLYAFLIESCGWHTTPIRRVSFAHCQIYWHCLHSVWSTVS